MRSRPGEAGGTGRLRLAAVSAGRTWPVPLFLAGGLTAENVGEAIARVRPVGVDVASGVECAPGVKDRGKLRRAFFEAVREGR